MATQKEPKNLRAFREDRGYKSLTEFCEAFKKATGERLPIPTLSFYETRGSGISERRFDILVKFLKLDKIEAGRLKKFFGGAKMKYVSPHKVHEYKGHTVKKKAKTKKSKKPVVKKTVSPSKVSARPSNEMERYKTLKKGVTVLMGRPLKNRELVFIFELALG